MLFGDPDVVAIDLQVGPSGFCGARVWLAGRPVGEPDLYGTVGALTEGLTRFRLRANERVQPILFNEAATTLLDLVDSAMFGAGDDLESSVATGKKYGPYLLSPNLCESLDEFLMVVVSDGNQQRILARSYVTGALIEAVVPDGRLESAFEAAERWTKELNAERDV